VTDQLQNHRVSATVDPLRGARLTSLVIDGHEVLGTASSPDVDPEIADGLFAMIPWAGRVRDGLVESGGAVHQLPRTDGPNALHGLGHVRPWQETQEGTYAVTLGAPWPTDGLATLRYTLLDAGIRVDLTWEDGTDEPCSIGLHPWFRRQLAAGDPLEADLRPVAMVERGEDGLPTGALVDPRPGPWDDCFRLAAEPVLTWPGALRLGLRSSADWWVVYDEPADTVCVEPQTVPPDAFGHPSLQPSSGWPHHVWLEISAEDLPAAV
jgi:aldose 1-epimerase